MITSISYSRWRSTATAIAIGIRPTLNSAMLSRTTSHVGSSFVELDTRIADSTRSTRNNTAVSAAAVASHLIWSRSVAPARRNLTTRLTAAATMHTARRMIAYWRMSRTGCSASMPRGFSTPGNWPRSTLPGDRTIASVIAAIAAPAVTATHRQRRLGQVAVREQQQQKHRCHTEWGCPQRSAERGSGIGPRK